jgi:tetratricopeptide (TPR) repeat protein
MKIPLALNGTMNPMIRSTGVRPSFRRCVVSLSSLSLLCLIAAGHSPMVRAQGTTAPPAPVSAKTAFQKGVDAFQRGDLATAQQEMQRAVDADADNADAQGWLGFLLLKRNQPAAAISHLEKAIALKPEVADHFTNLGNALLLKPKRTAADTQRAIEMFQKATVASPDSSEAFFNLGFAYGRTGRNGEAAAAYKKAAKLKPRDARIQINLGQSLAQLGDQDGAAAAYRAASSLTPQDAGVWSALGTAEMKRKTPDRTAAVNALETARKLDPQNLNTLTMLGRLYADLGRNEESGQAFAEAATLMETKGHADAAVFYNTGVVQARAGKTDEAIIAYDKSIALKPDYYDALFNSGLLLYRQNRIDDAAERFAAAVKLRPSNAADWSNLGMMRLQQAKTAATPEDKKTRTGEAMYSYRKAVALNTTDYTSREMLAAMLLEEKRYDDAITIYKQMSALRPQAGGPYNAMGLAYQQKGDLPNALKSYKSAIQREPKLAAAHNNLGVVYEKQSKYADALASYKRALAADPKFADAKTNLARYDKKQNAKPTAATTAPPQSGNTGASTTSAGGQGNNTNNSTGGTTGGGKSGKGR